MGMAGIQIAKHMGCTVITTAGSQDKLDKARELGADHCINYNEADFLAETMSITDRAGVDVVLEAVGGEVLTKSIQALAMGGRAVTVGNTSRQPATVEPGLMLNRLLTLKGFSLAVQMGSGGVMQELQGHPRPLRPRQATDGHRPGFPPERGRERAPAFGGQAEFWEGVVEAIGDHIASVVFQAKAAQGSFDHTEKPIELSFSIHIESV